MEQETPESCRFVKQSQSMSPNSFASYYGHRLPQCALIDEMGSGEGTSARGEDGDSDSKDALRVGEYICSVPVIRRSAHAAAVYIAIAIVEQSRRLN